MGEDRERVGRSEMTGRDDNGDRERIVQEGPGEVVEGDDQIPREPAAPLDPYTPEPGPAPGERRAFGVMRITWLVLAAVIVVLVLWALLR